MDSPRASLKTLRTAGALAVVVGLSSILPAGAQVAPPQRGGGEETRVPRYVDSADYDREPYYVDGVQYKPYVPEKKKSAKPADAVSKPAAAKVPQPVVQAPANPAAGELRPFKPAPASASNSVEAKPGPKPAEVATASREAARASASASASSSSAAYIPKKRLRYASAIIAAVDKVTAENVRFEAPIGQPVRYKGLIYIVRACETTADDEPAPDVIAYMQVRTSPSEATPTAAALKSREIFRGWTFASAPSLNPVQHPVYDAWVIACRRPLAG